MSEVQGPGEAARTQRLQRMRAQQLARKAESGGSSLPARQPDSAEFSQEARLMSQVRNTPAVRQELVQAVKAKINNPAYNLDAAFDRAMERLISDDLLS